MHTFGGNKSVQLNFFHPIKENITCNLFNINASSNCYVKFVVLCTKQCF